VLYFEFVNTKNVQVEYVKTVTGFFCFIPIFGLFSITLLEITGKIEKTWTKEVLTIDTNCYRNVTYDKVISAYLHENVFTGNNKKTYHCVKPMYSSLRSESKTKWIAFKKVFCYRCYNFFNTFRYLSTQLPFKL